MNRKIAIIGAGIAGMNSALKLSRSFDVTLFEAKSVPGGRLMSFYSKEFGGFLDNGQHIAVGAYKEFFELLESLQTKQYFSKIKGIKFPYHTSKSNFILDTTALPGKAGMVLGLLACNGLSFKDKFSFFNLAAKLSRRSYFPGCDSVLEMLSKNNQTENIVKIFWEPITLATLNQSIEKAPAELLVNVLQKAFFSGGGMSTILLPQIPLADYFLPFEGVLNEKHGRVIFNKRVKQIKLNDDESFKLIFADAQQIDFDKVICSIPPFDLAKILDDKFFEYEYFKNIYKFSGSPIISIYFRTNKELEKYDMSAFVDYKTQWIFNRTKIIKNDSLPKNEHGFDYTATISSAHSLENSSPEEVFSIFEAEIRNVYSDMNITDFKITAKKVIIDRRATVDINIDNFKLRPNVKSPIDNFYLTGDWVNTGLPATMESAALSSNILLNIIKDD